jgi:hypothetical protein
VRKWDVLEVPDWVPVRPTVQSDSVTLEFHGRIHRFDAKDGAWDVSPSVREILDSIPDEDEPAPRD